MSNSTIGAPICTYCGGRHEGRMCPKIKAIEYHANGAIKKIEFK